MRKLFAVLIVLFLWAGSSWGQTTIISPSGAGGFELGVTFEDNGWTVSNSANNPWVTGLYVSAAPFSNRSAYVSNDAGVTNNYTNTVIGLNYFYRDVTIPAGESKIALTFDWVANGESTWDLIQVFVAPTSITPVGSTTYPGSGLSNVPADIAGATFVGSANLSATIQTATFFLPPSSAGTTVRLIFAWKNDSSGGSNPGGSVDNISLTSTTPSSISSTALGGLWSSPATWTGGIVPGGGDEVTIVSGSTVVLNQSAITGNLFLNGTLQWITTPAPSSSVNPLQASNITIGASGKLYAHGTVGAGATIAVTGNFTNNGFANLAASGTGLRFNGTSGTQTLDGSGTFLADQQGRGMIANLLFSSLADCEISTAQNLVTSNLAHTAGTLNTRGLLAIDNTAICYGNLINRSITTVTVNNMGAGYTSAPTVIFADPLAGGTTATGVANYDAATGTVRSITITNPGNGYPTAPAVTFSGGGFTTEASAVANLYNVINFGTNSLGQNSAIAAITGGLDIKSDQSVGSVWVTNGGAGYTSAPTVGFSLPTGHMNLVTAGGSGYTAAPTVVFTGGGGTGAVGAAVVTRGQVTSVNISTAGTGYTSAPVISFTGGGGGSGATAALPAGALPTATATIDATFGMVTGFTVTNGGFGYIAAPTVTLTGGGFSAAATGATSRLGLYNLTLSWFIPSASNGTHSESDFIPANRRINTLALNSATGFGLNLTGNLELYGASPLTLTGDLNLGGNTLLFSRPSYTGTSGSATAFVSNGAITYKLFGSTTAVTRPFPFNSYGGSANHQVSMGSAVSANLATEGSTITTLTGSMAGPPTGIDMIGTRTLRIQTNGGLYGNNPTVRLAWNSLDALVADASFFTIAEASTLNGPWAIRSIPSGTGIIDPNGGSRTTATTAPGPIGPTGDYYYGWNYDAPACPLPSAATTTVITTTTAVLDWTNGGSETLWNVKYGAPGFDPLTEGTLINVSAHPYTLNPPLTSGTAYSWYVQADCGGGSTSNWAGPYNFTTQCEAIVTLPWTEGFEGVTIPAIPSCWAEYGDYVTTNNTNTTNDADARTGAQFLRESWFGTNEFVWTPGFALNSGTSYDFSFWWAGDDFAGWTGDVFYNSTPDAIGATQMGLSFVTDATVTTKTYAQVIKTFVPTTTGTYYFAIRVSCPTSAPWYLSFDDFEVKASPACPAPIDLAATTITENSAIIGWTQGGTETTWEYVYGTSPLDPPAGAGTTTSLTSIPLSGLSSNTTYQFYVRADCGGQFSSWSGPIAFTTLCDVVTTLSENFDAVTVPALPNCWSKYISPLYTSATVATYATGPYSSPNSVRLYSSGATAAIDAPMLISPAISNLNADTHRLRFFAKGASSNLSVVIGTMSDPLDASTFTPFQTVTGLSTSVWTEAIVSFDSYAGTDQYIAFAHPMNTTYSYIYIDNVIWEVIPTATLSWYNLQWPASASILANQNENVYAQCWESGVTEAAGPGVGIECWIGYSTDNTNPNTWTNWVPASYNYGVDPNNNDEYQASLGAAQGLAPGTYYYASRFRYLAGPYTYGGFNSGPWDGITNVSGVLTVNAIPAATLPFTEGFETGQGNWIAVNGIQANQWHVGTATAKTGTQSVYVSNDGGASNAYTITTTSVSHFYRDITFPAGTNNFDLSFSWKGVGETGLWDYMRVSIVPTSTMPVAGTWLAAGQVGVNYYNQATWQDVTLELDNATYAGQTWRVVFSWRNDAIDGLQPPTAIDDIIVEVQAPATKTLNLTSVLLEGLYIGGGNMKMADDGTGNPQFPGYADQITVELHDGAAYGTILHTAIVMLSTTGAATVSDIPASLNGNYYITVKHRNSIETVSATAISFASDIVNQSFGAPADVFGGNLQLMVDNYYAIFAGDVNQDGIVDTGDMTEIDNDSANYVSGYIPTDVTGDGTADTSDMTIVDNNSNNYVGAITP